MPQRTCQWHEIVPIDLVKLLNVSRATIKHRLDRGEVHRITDMLDVDLLKGGLVRKSDLKLCEAITDPIDIFTQDFQHAPLTIVNTSRSNHEPLIYSLSVEGGCKRMRRRDFIHFRASGVLLFDDHPLLGRSPVFGKNELPCLRRQYRSSVPAGLAGRPDHRMYKCLVCERLIKVLA